MSLYQQQVDPVSFATESEMAGPVEAWLRARGSSSIGREVEVGFGIPDLVGGVGAIRSLQNRRRQAGPITNATQLAVLQFCRRPRTKAELHAWAPRGFYELMRRALRPLIDVNLMTVVADRFRSKVAPKDPFDTLIAVELKLSDVRRGVAQAHSYRLFADASYLALPANRISAGVMQDSRDVGIGLLAVSAGWVEETVQPVRPSIATAGRRRMASEHTLAASAQSASRVAGSPRTNMR